MRHRLLAWADRLCAYDHCKVPLPWFAWRGKTDAVSRLHQKALAFENRGRNAAPVFLISAIAALLHAIRGTRENLNVWRRLRRACTEGYGVSAGRQLALLLVATFRYNLPPKSFYALRLFKLERRRWPAIFSHGEITLILAEIEARAPHKELWTKNGWAAFCVQHDIPGVEVAAMAWRHELQIRRPDLLQPGRDLFIKPDVDYSARGGIMLTWNEADRGWDAAGAATGLVPAAGLARFLTGIDPDKAMLVQPRLRNDPDLADLTAHSLANARVITLNTPGNGIEFLVAVLRVPPFDEPVSDIVGSTVGILIDPETGRLGHISGPRLQFGDCDCHPHRGVRVRDRVLKPWPKMRELALATHAKLPFMPVVGWDVIATTEGVKILEANAVWNANVGQAWGQQPLGETVWPQRMLTALEQTAPAAGG